jgi:hypothetical protein
MTGNSYGRRVDVQRRKARCGPLPTGGTSKTEIDHGYDQFVRAHRPTAPPPPWRGRPDHCGRATWHGPSLHAEPGKLKLPTIQPGAHTSFGALKQIVAGVLNVGYAEVGPAGGPPVILLHGRPYDIHSFVDVAPALASAGYRVIIPYLRGYGTTRFLLRESRRNGQRVTASRSAQVQSATIISNRVLAPLIPHNTNATMQRTKATIPVDHSSQ